MRKWLHTKELGELAGRMASAGASGKEVAVALQVTYEGLQKLKEEYPTFKKAIEQGKERFDEWFYSLPKKREV